MELKMIIWPLITQILMSQSPWIYEKINPAVEKINVDKMSEKLNPSLKKSSMMAAEPPTSHHCDSPGEVHTKHEDDNEKIDPTVDKMSEKLNQSLIKDRLKQNLQDKVLFLNLTGSMPLDVVFFLLLMHICGADRVAAASTVFAHMFSAEGLIELAASLLPVLYVTSKWKRDKAELEKKNSELLKKEQDLVMTLTEVKNKLDNWRNQLRGVLDDIEKKKDENKQKLQLVEKEITEREATFDKPEELLRDKENLLRNQWKLDQIKKDTERQLLNNEKLMDPIEMQVTRHRMDKENVQT